MERLRQAASFTAVILLVTFLIPTKSLAQFGGPPRKTTCSELKEICKELEPYKEKVQEIAGLLLEGVEHDFQVKIDFDLVYRRSAMRFSRSRKVCTIGISAKQVKNEVKTEAGLAGILAHEIGHCFQHSEGDLPPMQMLRSHFIPIPPTPKKEDKKYSRPGRESDAEQRGVVLMTRNPFYTIWRRRVMLERRAEQAKQKGLIEVVINHYQRRWQMLLQAEQTLKATGKDGAMYVIFSPQEFRTFRQLLIEKIKK